MENKNSNNITSDEPNEYTFDETWHYRKLHINNFPYEVHRRILSYLSFGEIAKLRLVSRLFNEICGDILSSEFKRLKNVVQVRFAEVKSKMPRRESSRRKHALSRENDIIETLQARLSLLNITIGKHVESNHCYFFPGEILDEINRLLKRVKESRNLNRAYKETDELFDLSTMAVEFFKEHIQPTLPEVTAYTESMAMTGITPPIFMKKLPRAPINPTISLGALNASLEETKRLAHRNEISINVIKSSIKKMNGNVDKLRSVVDQIKKDQNDYKGICIPEDSLDVLMSELNHFNLLLNSLKSKLPKNEVMNKLSNIKPVETCLNSEPVNPWESVPENAGNNAIRSISYESMASTSTAYNERKDVSENIPKKRKMVASTSAVYNKRKDGKVISENIPKNRETRSSTAYNKRKDATDTFENIPKKRKMILLRTCSSK